MARDIKAEVKKATAPKKGTASEVKKAQDKGTDLRAKQAAKSNPKSTSTRVRTMGPRELSKRIEKDAQATKPKDAPVDKDRLSKSMERIKKATSDLEKGKHTVSATARKKAEAGVIRTVDPKKSNRGRKADPNSKRSEIKAKQEALKKAGKEVRRGRPSSPKREAARAATEKRRSEAVKSGKTTARGRPLGSAKAESQRSLRKDRVEASGERMHQPMEQRSDTLMSSPKSRSMKPSEVKTKYQGMDVEPEANRMNEERGLHHRGNTTVTYSAEGNHKMSRRTVQVGGKRGGTISVTKNMIKDPNSDSYKPYASTRQLSQKDFKKDEQIRHHPTDPTQSRKVRFTSAKSKAGLISEKMEVGEGRKSLSSADRTKRGKITKPASPRAMFPSTGANPGVTDAITRESKHGYHNAMEMTRDRTQANRNFAPITPSHEKVPISRSTYKPTAKKTRSMKKK